MIPTVSNFTMHDALGHAVLKSEWQHWVQEHSGPGEFGVITHYSWQVSGEDLIAPIDISKVLWHELPDASGFICFESGFIPNGCCILDAYGKIRHRLAVPCDLTPYDVPPGAECWFRGPSVHDDGQFGVAAWIEYAGDFYFELDYHAGRFLWGREIRF